ncbi:serine hydrolase domain-containing protein [Tenacibaculum jejuense]|uniref:Secreted beta-lactamase family protein n=1 Tax=Tenacibaculum jejuense TaxID=584609 RepID=A0A238UE37_9FLAO|nr:serine hydrolase domain-containing protein [Tenacibaculum jejuense]SNR17421.1 Secreted beta-lactamase family protein [Tenacibaculum jejuense]
MRPLFFLYIFCFSITGFSQRTDHAIDSLFNSYFTNGTFNGSALVIKDNQIIYQKALGYATSNKQTQLSIHSKFLMGSIYKEFPAVAIMQLVENNKLTINQSIHKILPELPQWSAKITIKHLLQYSSGLPKVNWKHYFSNQIIPTDKSLFEDIKNVSKLKFTPGSDYLYTNMSPVLLIKIIEKVTKLSFEEYLTKNMLNPYQIEGIKIKDQFPFLDKENMAMPFNKDFKDDPYKVAIKNELISSNVNGLYLWLKKLDDFEIISKESMRFLSQKANKETHTQAPLGSCSWKNNDINIHHHHGSSGNFECLVTRDKTNNIFVILLTNQKNRNLFEITNKILNN